MRTEKNIILIRHAKWLWDNKLKKQSKECRKQAYENNNFRSTRNGEDNDAVESSRRVHTGRR